MSLATLPAPPNVDTPAAGRDENEVHYLCCNPDIALCGVDLTGEDVDYAEGDEDDCRLCVYMLDEALPCPDPNCPGGAE